MIAPLTGGRKLARPTIPIWSFPAFSRAVNFGCSSPKLVVGATQQRNRPMSYSRTISPMHAATAFMSTGMHNTVFASAA